ncbi:hypothetical protein H8E88_01430 [candidate division KSB1 bacterium]|nr:hypothetical protein [candidate division KSB1 bacterium]
MLTRNFDGDCANAFERERLGWIDVVEITVDITANLSDYLITGDAYKYHPPDGYSNEYYYFENHQKINTTYDDATVNADDKGIFVIHQKDIYGEQNNILCKVADGRWDWENPFWTDECYNLDLPAYRQVTLDPSETNHRDTQQHTQGGWDWVYVLADENNNFTCGNFRRGFEFADTFNPNTTTVISPWSNPNTNIWGDPYPVVITFAMEIIGQYEEIINVHFYLSNPEDAKPSRPRNLAVTFSDNDHPFLTWENNTEPDLSYYEIYKKRGSGNWFLLTTTTNNYYEDQSEIKATGRIKIMVYYNIKAVDTSSKKSNPSSTVSIVVKELVGIPKSLADEGIIPSAFSLNQNYPNPFNPITTIKYDLLEDSFVKLRIFNLLGEEIRTLAVGKESAGFKTTIWNEKDKDGSAISSGMYIYNFSAKSLESDEEFHQIRKMVLLR